MYNINQFCHCEDSEGICGNLSILLLKAIIQNWKDQHGDTVTFFKFINLGN